MARAEPINRTTDCCLDPIDELPSLRSKRCIPHLCVDVVQVIENNSVWLIYLNRAAHKHGIEMTYAANFSSDCCELAMVHRQSGFPRDPFPCRLAG